MSFRASINHGIAISTSIETFENLNSMFCLFGDRCYCISLMSDSVPSRLLTLNSRRVADGQIDLSSPIYENHFLNAVLCVSSMFSPLKKYNSCRKLEINQQ
jgi:hypothetical protein